MEAPAEANGSRRIRAVVAALGVALAYYAGARVGFALTPASQPVSTLWPPNAILLGALLLAPVRSWYWVLLAAFPAHLAVELGSGVPLPMVLSWFVSNCAEALLGAAGVRFFIDRPVRFDTFRRVAVFVVFAALLAPFLSSFLDAALVQWNGWGTAGFWEVWRVRFFSNVIAIVTLVPAIVTWGNTDIASLRSIGWRRMLEAAALAGGLLVVCAVVFSRSSLAVHAYAPLPFLLWAAVRFGPGGASAGLLVLALVSTWGAIHGEGPFVGRSITDNVLALQLFLFVTYVPLMTLAAAIRQRDRAEREARRSEQWLNLALGAGQVAAWDWDVGRDRASWSENFPEILGRGVVDRRTFLESVVADDRPAIESAITQAIDQVAPYEVEFRTVREDGAVRWLTGKGTVVRDAAGRAVRILGVNADITERKAAAVALQHEAALRESEAWRRVASVSSPATQPGK